MTKQVGGKPVSLFTDEAALKASVHGRLACAACHTGIAEIPHAEKLTPVSCQKCHSKAAGSVAQSIHARAGVDCQGCHGSHTVTRATKMGLAACEACHAQTVQAYQRGVHGLAIRGGSKVAANCASCHGIHDIRSSADPKSAIHPDNLPATCGKCHPGAGANFAKGKVHVSLTAQEEPILFYAREFYILMILGTIGGMVAHNGLDFLRKLRREYRRSGGGAAAVRLGEYNSGPLAPQRWIQRMSVSERWQHALLASSFIVLVYTGFALKFPENWLFTWFVALEKGYALRSWIHRIAALVMILACLWHLGYLLTRRGRAHLIAMLPRVQDVKEVLQNIGCLLGLRAEPPRLGRFSYIEKAEYLAVIWGSMIMAGTGFMLWFENQTLRFLPKWVLDLATIVHYYEAWLATLAILVWHFYFVIFNPNVYPMNWTWLTGRISEEMLHHEHPSEYEELRERGEL